MKKHQTVDATPLLCYSDALSLIGVAKFDLHLIDAHLEWPLHERPPPPEDDGAEEGEAVEGPDGEAEEVDQRPHVAAEHEQDRESALGKRAEGID